MKEQLNNICFEFDGEQYNVPISAPWELYMGIPRQAAFYGKDINRENTPPYFILHLTQRCNLRCRYCFEGVKGTRDITKETVNAWIEYIKREGHKQFSVRFFGGEPTLRIDLIRYILEQVNKCFPAKAGYEVSYNIFTNAVYLSEELLQLVKENHIGCFVSMDGCREIHDTNRIYPNGKGSYAAVLENAKRLQKESDSRIIIRAVYDVNKNITLLDIVEECCKNGFDMISIELPWVEDTSSIALNEEKQDMIKKMIQEYAHECVNRIYRNDYSLLSLYEIFKHISKVSFNVPILYTDACSAGKTAMAIDVDGSIYPCHSFVGNEEYLLGNVTDGILNKKLKEKFEGYTCETLPDCRDCAIRYYCTKRCFADSLWFNKSVTAVNPFRCEIEKEYFKAAMYIYGKIKEDEERLIKTRLMIWQFQYMDQYK